MRKLLLTVVATAVSVLFLNGQDLMFLKGEKVLNLGLGLGNTLYSGSYYKSQVPPVSASLEIGVVDNVIEKGVVGVGPYLGYSSFKYEYSDWGWKYSNIIIGARGSFHYPLVDKLDTYTGLLLGYNIASSKEFGNSVPGWDYSYSAGGLTWSWYIGGRYYFKENLAAMLELGYGIAYLNLGIALKI
ncbi:MAG TPA: hypothetical protein PK106_00495 [Bacteroidales bacterium]|jgi:hypothetical protein|nr:hypothetical protein [Bacteroidales bacterium]